MAQTTFLFTLTGSEGKYDVTLSVDQKPVARAEFEYEATSSVGVKINKIEKGICDQDELQFVGVELWARLRSGAVEDYFAANSTEWLKDSQGWQVRLRIKPRELEVLPWECLYDKDLGFLCQKRLPYVTLLRDHELRSRGSSTRAPTRDRTQMLVVIPHGSFLQVEQEWHNLKACMDEWRDRVQIEPLMGRVTPDQLDATVRRKHWDIVHYVGHGKLGEDGKSVIRFNSPAGFDEESWLDAEPFAELFSPNAPTLVPNQANPAGFGRRIFEKTRNPWFFRVV
jgi:hypothetical protein